MIQRKRRAKGRVREREREREGVPAHPTFPALVEMNKIRIIRGSPMRYDPHHTLPHYASKTMLMLTSWHKTLVPALGS